MPNKWPRDYARAPPAKGENEPKSLVLGGPWELVTTYNWASNPTYNPPKWAYRGYPKYK